MTLGLRAFASCAALAIVLAACTPVRTPANVGESFCIHLASQNYERATYDAGELMADMQPYSNNEALATFAVWVAGQPCAKHVAISGAEVYTMPAIREVSFLVELDDRRQTCIADFHMAPPWVVTFHDCSFVKGT